MPDLKGKTALVTGASSGVGRAIALELAALGALVLLVARTPEKLQAVAAEVREIAGETQTFAVDLTDDSALSSLSHDLQARCPRLDWLVHSAGLFSAAPLASAPLAAFDSVMRCNVRAPLALTQALLPAVCSAGGGIVFINSTAGERTHANVGHYAASKHALKAIADTLRLEISPQGVRVLSVMLGRTATPMQEQVCRLEGSIYDPRKFLQPSAVASAVVAALIDPAKATLTDLHLRTPTT